jgi:hypothetical protein
MTAAEKRPDDEDTDAGYRDTLEEDAYEEQEGGNTGSDAPGGPEAPDAGDADGDDAA